MNAKTANTATKTGAVVALNRSDQVDVELLGHMGDALNSIIKVGRLLIKEKLAHKRDTKVLYDKLPFSRRTAEKYMVIANDGRLIDESNQKHLPASWGTLYLISRLENEQFSAAIEGGVITPTVTRKAIADYINSMKPAANDDVAKPVEIFTIFADIKSLDIKEIEQIEMEIEKLISEMKDARVKGGSAVRKLRDDVEANPNTSINARNHKMQQEAIKLAQAMKEDLGVESLAEHIGISKKDISLMHPAAQLKAMGGDPAKFGVSEDIAKLKPEEIDIEMKEQSMR